MSASDDPVRLARKRFRQGRERVEQEPRRVRLHQVYGLLVRPGAAPRMLVMWNTKEIIDEHLEYVHKKCHGMSRSGVEIREFVVTGSESWFRTKEDGDWEHREFVPPLASNSFLHLHDTDVSIDTEYIGHKRYEAFSTASDAPRMFGEFGLDDGLIASITASLGVGPVQLRGAAKFMIDAESKLLRSIEADAVAVHPQGELHLRCDESFLPSDECGQELPPFVIPDRVAETPASGRLADRGLNL